jgi:hypothetical protein
MKQWTREEPALTNARYSTHHTTIALQKITKARLDGSKAPGQCYDGFISELVQYWERYQMESTFCQPGRPIPQDAEKECSWKIVGSELQFP